MFQKKKDKLFNWMPNVFSIADDILIAGFDELGKDYNATPDKLFSICRQANVMLNNDKSLFRCTSILPSEKYLMTGFQPGSQEGTHINGHATI